MTAHFQAGFLERLAFNSCKGMSLKTLMGRNAAISTAAETIWTPGATYAQVTTAVAFEAISSSTNDTSAGTGARTISVDLVDGNYAQTTVTVTMNGTTAVAITGTFVACNGARVLTAGSTGSNAGNVDIRTVSGSVVKRRIATLAAGSGGIDQDFLYTIPANHVGVVKNIDFGGTGLTGGVSVYLLKYDSVGMIQVIGLAQVGLSTIVTSPSNPSDFRLDFDPGYFIPEKSLIELRVIATAGAGDFSAIGTLILSDRSSGGI